MMMSRDIKHTPKLEHAGKKVWLSWFFSLGKILLNLCFMFLIHIYHMSKTWQVPLLCPYVRSPRPSLDSERRHQALARQGGQVPHWGVMHSLVQLDRDGIQTENLSRSQAFPGYSKVLIRSCHTRRSQLVLNFYEWGTFAELVESCDVLLLDWIRTFEKDSPFCSCFSHAQFVSVACIGTGISLYIVWQNCHIFCTIRTQRPGSQYGLLIVGRWFDDSFISILSQDVLTSPVEMIQVYPSTSQTASNHCSCPLQLSHFLQLSHLSLVQAPEYRKETSYHYQFPQLVKVNFSRIAGFSSVFSLMDARKGLLTLATFWHCWIFCPVQEERSARLACQKAQLLLSWSIVY